MQEFVLDGSWQFRQAGKGSWMPASVPGGNFTDLLANDLIPDPFVGENELAVQWVTQADWDYRKLFDAPQALRDCRKVFLQCDGLDTLATVQLNGLPVGQSDNMFVAFEADVTGQLRPRGNRLDVHFDSPVVAGNALKKGKTFFAGGLTMDAAWFVRKSASQFGWDWGPKLPQCGIWRSIRLRGYNHARLTDVHIRQHHQGQGQKVRLDVAVDVQRWSDAPLHVRLTLVGPQTTHTDTYVATVPTNGASQHCMTIGVDVQNPQLWWPNGYGAQPLYDVVVQLLDDQGNQLDINTRRVGLRTIELRQQDDEFGRCFTFVVNGVAIFAKGANWIPADVFPARISDQQYAHLVRSAADANMNMLRVWGGGFYEDDRFYDLCDELGILVWQDFMFACGIYPDEEETFQAAVRREGEYNVRRLRSRTCLALWCGNNEMESAWNGWGWARQFPPAKRQAHMRMFRELIPGWLAPLDDSPYWPSSPSSASLSESPDSSDSGDVHDWGVWHGMVPFTHYRKQMHRFASEFGFQAFPPVATIRQFADPAKSNLTDPVMEHHQKSPSGNGKIITYLSQHFRLPSDFADLSYLSQVLQAQAMRIGIEHWRRINNRCSGTLYWQLNDVWPGPSWSSIDCAGRWKALNYFARRFFAPVIVSAEDTSGLDHLPAYTNDPQPPIRVNLHVTNDRVEPFTGLLRWTLMTLGGKTVRSAATRIKAAPQANTKAAELDLTFALRKHARRDLVLWFELTDNSGQISHGSLPLAPDKHMNLADPKITAKVRDAKDRWEITLAGKSYARFVQVEIAGVDVVFSDNFFDLPAGKSLTVTLPKARGLTLAQIRRKLRVHSEWDTI